MTAALAEVARFGRRLDDFEAKLAASADEIAQIPELRSGLAELTKFVRELLETDRSRLSGRAGAVVARFQAVRGAHDGATATWRLGR